MSEMVHQGQKLSAMEPATKKAYQAPTLSTFGQVALLTQGGSCNEANDNNTFTCNPLNIMGMNASDRRLKTDIVQVGAHPMGFGLYLFSYKPEYQAQWGHGRQFGVMADEVAPVVPEAVDTHPDGYQVVSYAMLGITPHTH